ncbi:MAG: hypothetical protein IKS25_03775 [Oscillospiraceae bacterium]|nr:hypothetical protein [Oscillospiraceae bacterium]
MDKVELGRSAALAVGVVVGLVIALILLRYMNRDHKVKAEYDEMQKIIRNKGYMLAFYAVMILEALLCLVPGSLQIPAEPIVLHFLPIFLGITVQACYCIWNGAYVGLNTNMKRYLIVAVAASLINLLAFVMAWKNGGLLVDGVLQAPFVNLLCAVMFAVLGVVGLLRRSVQREESGE